MSAALLLALIGCSPAAGPPDRTPLARASASSAPADDPDGPTGRLRQFRRDVLLRMLQVTVSTPAALQVRAVQLEAGAFPDSPREQVDVDLPAGGVVDLPIRYGAADCARPPGAAVAVLSVVQGAGLRQVHVPLADGGLLSRLQEGECTDRALARAASLEITRLSERGEARPPWLRGVLRLDRRVAGTPVTVTDVGAHIIFTVRADGLPVRLGPTDDRAEVAFTLEPTRCDPHALAENKRAGVLGFYLALGDAPARLTTVVPDPATQARLVEFAVQGCRGRASWPPHAAAGPAARAPGPAGRARQCWVLPATSASPRRSRPRR